MDSVDIICYMVWCVSGGGKWAGVFVVVVNGLALRSAKRERKR